MIQFTRQFALFKQTVLNDTRSFGLQLLRFLFAAILGILVYFAQSEASRWREIDGLFIFQFLFAANIFFILFSCLFLFLPLIKEEKEESTLGMILMTGISPFAYLTGRVGSRLFMFVLMLAVQIPIIYLCITLGGIDMKTIMLSYTLLLLIIFHLGNAFVLGSLLCSNLFTGILISCGISLIFNYLFNFSISSILDMSRPEEPFRALEKTLNYIFSSNFRTSPEIMFWTFAFYIGSGILFFMSSVYYFDVLTDEQEDLELPEKLKGKKSSSEKADSLEGKGLKPLYRKLKTKRFGKMPLIYKDFRFTAFGPLLYILQFATICYLFYEVGYNWNNQYRYDYYGYQNNINRWLHNFSEDCIPTLSIMSGVVIIFCSNLLFASEIKNKTLGALLLLPHDHVKIYWQKTLCMLRIAAPSLLTLSAAVIIYVFTGFELQDEYYGNSYQIKEVGLIICILVPGYFINTYLSLAFKKYSFFLAAGLTFGWFFLHILFFEFANLQIEEGLITLFITGSVASVLSYLRSLKNISAHSITA